ncbi:hypothetical protein NL676_036337 [Syzygium grande]|nr:hypothetical protein NL676_036337 [Syzygium grande]
MRNIQSILIPRSAGASADETVELAPLLLSLSSDSSPGLMKTAFAITPSWSSGQFAVKVGDALAPLGILNASIVTTGDKNGRGITQETASNFLGPNICCQNCGLGSI